MASGAGAGCNEGEEGAVPEVPAPKAVLPVVPARLAEPAEPCESSLGLSMRSRLRARAVKVPFGKAFRKSVKSAGSSESWISFQ